MFFRKDDMVRVDAYMVPRSMARAYIADREACAEAAMAVMRTFCAHVSRDWAGSEDGEAVVGCDERGDLICMIHLDPEGIEEMKHAIAADRLKAFLLEYNGLADA